MGKHRNPGYCKHFPLCDHLKPLAAKLSTNLLDTYARVFPKGAEPICSECGHFERREVPTSIEEITSTAEGRGSIFRLELQFQDLTIREYRFQDGDSRFIGRDPDNHIVISDSGVSRSHACIAQMGEQLFICDTDSKHGTLVNGVSVICANLKHGDLVSIGVNHKLKVSITTQNREGTVTAFLDRGRNLMTTT